MRFELTDDQEALVAALKRLTARHAGAERARSLGGAQPTYDAELDEKLDDAGFYDICGHDTAGALEAALVVETVAYAAGVVSVGGRALVLPSVTETSAGGPVALVVDGDRRGVRYAVPGATLVIVGADTARLVTLDDCGVTGVDSRYGYPMGQPTYDHLSSNGGTSLGAGSAERVRAWWRVALAVELAATMRAALDLTLTYTTDRKQFGRPIASFQAVQHRLAECAVAVDGSRWLALEAAWSGADPESAAVALTYAVDASTRVFAEMHQFTGAMGFTAEYDLHLWTMRIPALRAEANALGSPALAAAERRWLEATT